MANSRMYLVCRHCGEKIYMAKGYYGEYGTRYGKHGLIGTGDDYVEKLDNFFDEHGLHCEKGGFYSEDNARTHFIILEEGEEWDCENNSIITRDDAVIKLPDEF